MTSVACAAEAANTLGESPVWDDAAGVLWWIDIHGRSLHRYHPASGSHGAVALGDQVGSVCLRRSGGLVAATRDGFSLLDSVTGVAVPIASPLAGMSDIRFNDGRAGPDGRFWAGTVQEKRVAGEAALYRLGVDGASERVLGGITVANGICWSPDRRTMYLADSHVREIYAFDFDARSGELSRRRLFVSFPPEYGMPDGSTVDADGNVWSAAIHGWHVLKFTPDGRLDDAIRMPVAMPTSCAFGGPDLSTLFVTSASMRLSEDERAEQPQAGHLFALATGARGLPEPRYAG